MKKKENNYLQFKFSPINKNVIDSLVRGYLYFAQSHQLNDPFENAPGNHL